MAGWVRSQGRDDLVNRPPPDALVASVSDALERQRSHGMNGHVERLEGVGNG